MHDLISRWWRRRGAPSGHLVRPDHRPDFTWAMCRPCARRWLAGRSLWHPWCGVQLRHAFDLYFERLHDQA